MKIEEFIETYEKDGKVENFIKTDYIPYIDKVSLCSSVAKSTSYKDVAGRKVFKVSSPNRHLFLTMKLIEIYTTLEIADGGDFIDQFDELARRGLITYIFSEIPQTEVEEIQNIMAMTMDDLYDNEYSTTSALVGLKDAIYAIGDGLFSGFQTALEKMVEENAEDMGEVE